MNDKKLLRYRFLMFKLEGHSTWRITSEGSIKEVKGKITHAKMLEIDRITGKVSLLKYQE